MFAHVSAASSHCVAALFPNRGRGAPLFAVWEAGCAMPAKRVRSSTVPGRRRRSRPSVPVPVRRGGVQISEVQRARMLNAAVAIVGEEGYERMSSGRVARRARVSRRTFYDLFSDREDCFLAAFDDVVARLEGLVVGAYEQERGQWPEKTRAALVALLVFLDEQPGVCGLLVVDALKAGLRVQQRRVEVLERVTLALREGGSHAKGAHEVSLLAGEGVVGAVFSVVHTRVLSKRPGSMLEVLNPLMGVIVLPYLGAGAARRELERPVAKIPRASRKSSTRAAVAVVAMDPLAGLNMRLTYRTLRVLTVIAELESVRTRPDPGSGPSNRVIGEASGIADQGQISKLLQRLERLELIVNATPGNRKQPTGEPNAWRLTARGREVQQATRVDSAEGQGNGVAS